MLGDAGGEDGRGGGGISIPISPWEPMSNPGRAEAGVGVRLTVVCLRLAAGPLLASKAKSTDLECAG